MRWIVVLSAVALGCGAAPDPAPAEQAERWTGQYRYQGTRTELRREGRYFRFSDARLGRYSFRLTAGGFLEDDTPDIPVRVFPDVKDDASHSATPYRSLRLTIVDEHLILLRVS